MKEKKMQLADLEQQYLDQRANYSEPFRLRIHRAMSWLKKAEKVDDLDSKFITLWIAFNAAYAREIEGYNVSEGALYNEFLSRIYRLDKGNRIYDIIWQKYSSSIQLLLENKFVSQAFWEFHNHKIDENEFNRRLDKEKEKARSALKDVNSGRLLEVLFRRLYTLRNQLLHGGATFNSKANRKQLQYSCDILTAFMPPMLEIMMQNHSEIDWGKPFYPYVPE